MGAESLIEPFALDDIFLRRVGSRIKHGAVSFKAFKPRADERTLSFTFRGPELKTEEGLKQYQRDKVLPSGDLPGICSLSFLDLTELLNPPLPPRCAPDPEDAKYGHLHCETDVPEDEVHMERMARLATKGGVLCEFERIRRRG